MPTFFYFIIGLKGKSNHFPPKPKIRHKQRAPLITGYKLNIPHLCWNLEVYGFIQIVLLIRKVCPIKGKRKKKKNLKPYSLWV